MTPFRLPMNPRRRLSTGTSLVTGFPPFVISRGFLVERTSSTSVRHRALNSLAATFFMDTLEHTRSHAYNHLLRRNYEFSLIPFPSAAGSGPPLPAGTAFR